MNSNGKSEILAYYTLALKTLIIPPEALPSKVLRKIGGKHVCGQELPVHLIGQLGKNTNVSPNPIKGSFILETAIQTILLSKKIVGGRIVLLECENNKNLINFYSNNEFIMIPPEINGEEEKLIQWIKVI